MVDTFIQLSAVRFDDAVELYDCDEAIDGSSPLPLIAYDLMLPLMQECDVADRSAGDGSPMRLHDEHSRGALRRSA